MISAVHCRADPERALLMCDNITGPVHCVVLFFKVRREGKTTGQVHSTSAKSDFTERALQSYLY